MALLFIPNGPMQTTAAFVVVTTGTVIKTMLQVKPSATLVAKVSAWGYSLDTPASATTVKVELIETDVAATVTASVANDITKEDGDALALGDVTTNLIQVGTTATGYTSSGEGTITAVRNLDAPQIITPPFVFDKKFSLGDEPVIQVSKFGRIRVTTGVACNMYCWMLLKI